MCQFFAPPCSQIASPGRYTIVLHIVKDGKAEILCNAQKRFMCKGMGVSVVHLEPLNRSSDEPAPRVIAMHAQPTAATRRQDSVDLCQHTAGVFDMVEDVVRKSEIEGCVVKRKRFSLSRNVFHLRIAELHVLFNASEVVLKWFDSAAPATRQKRYDTRRAASNFDDPALLPKIAEWGKVGLDDYGHVPQIV